MPKYDGICSVTLFILLVDFTVLFNIITLSLSPNFFSDYVYLIRFIMIINVFAILFLVRFIFENGSEFVNWPLLVPRDYRYYRGPGAASYKVPRHTDSEYGEKIELQKIE